jgi:hypothetical protein
MELITLRGVEPRSNAIASGTGSAGTVGPRAIKGGVATSINWTVQSWPLGYGRWGGSWRWQRHEQFALIERERITFEVDRIWKGFVSRRVVIYGETPFMDAFFFRRGTKYFVAAHRPTPDERMELEVFLDTPKTFFVVAGCGGGSYAFSPTSPADPTGLGPGRLP